MSASAQLLFTLYIGCLALFGLNIWWYVVLSKWNKQSRQEFDQVWGQRDQIIQDAREEASGIIDSASTQAANIEIEYEQYRQQWQQHINAGLDEVRRLEQSKLTEYQQQWHQTLDSLAAEWKNSVDQQLQDTNLKLQSDLSSQADRLESHLEDKVSAFGQWAIQQQEQVTKHLDQYKLDQQTSIDATIKQIIDDSVARSLGSILSEDQHTQLIIKSLEKAQNDEFFK